MLDSEHTAQSCSADSPTSPGICDALCDDASLGRSLSVGGGGVGAGVGSGDGADAGR